MYSSAVDVDDSIEELCTAYTSSLEEDASVVVSGVVASGIVVEVEGGGASDEVVCTSCSHVLVEEKVESGLSVAVSGVASSSTLELCDVVYSTFMGVVVAVSIG